MAKPQLFMLDLRITSNTSIDIPDIINQASTILSCQGTCKVIHKLKVTGEPRVISVLKAEDDISLEVITTKLGRIGIVDVTCTPLTEYEVFASGVLELDNSLTVPSQNKLDKKYTFWNDLTLDYHGMTWQAFRELWAKEASIALGLRTKGDLSADLFKIKNTRKVCLFISVDEPDQLDAMFCKLPLFIENGHNTGNVCRAVQQLDDYISKIKQSDI